MWSISVENMHLSLSLRLKMIAYCVVIISCIFVKPELAEEVDESKQNETFSIEGKLIFKQTHMHTVTHTELYCTFL